MIIKIRDYIWDVLMSKHPEGCVIPDHLLIIKAFLFPIRFLRYILSVNHGYDFISDIWNIHGIKFTGDALRSIAKSQGDVFKVSSKYGCIIITKYINKQDGPR